jgi:hypothetical protein
VSYDPAGNDGIVREIMKANFARVSAPSLLERIAACFSGSEREWFQNWLKIQGIEDPDGTATDNFVRLNREYVLKGLIMLLIATAVWVAFMGWVRRWW